MTQHCSECGGADSWGEWNVSIQEVKAGRSGMAMSTGLGGKGGKILHGIRAQSGRTYYRNIKVTLCNKCYNKHHFFEKKLTQMIVPRVRAPEPPDPLIAIHAREAEYRVHAAADAIRRNGFIDASDASRMSRADIKRAMNEAAQNPEEEFAADPFKYAKDAEAEPARNSSVPPSTPPIPEDLSFMNKPAYVAPKIHWWRKPWAPLKTLIWLAVIIGAVYKAFH